MPPNGTPAGAVLEAPKLSRGPGSPTGLPTTCSSSRAVTEPPQGRPPPGRTC